MSNLKKLIRQEIHSVLKEFSESENKLKLNEIEEEDDPEKKIEDPEALGKEIIKGLENFNGWGGSVIKADAWNILRDLGLHKQGYDQNSIKDAIWDLQEDDSSPLRHMLRVDPHDGKIVYVLHGRPKGGDSKHFSDK